MKQLGVGVIGVGVRGRHSWERILQLHPACEVKAVSLYPGISQAMLEGQGEEHARAYAEELGAQYCGDYREVIGRDDVHVISMMVEPLHSAKIAVEAAEAGKHIVSDKPTATTLNDAERIVNAVEAAGVKFLVTFSTRFVTPFVLARETVEAGKIGKLLVANFTYLMANGPLVGFTATREYAERVGGGEVTNFGCYAIDFLHWLTGSRVKRVNAQIANFFYEDYREAGIEDFGQLALEFENGVLGTMTTGRTTTQSGGPVISLDLTGTEGAYRTTRPTHGVTLFGDKTAWESYDESAPQKMIFEFVDAILEGRESPITAADGLHVLRVLKAAYRSAKEGVAVELSDL